MKSSPWARIVMIAFLWVMWEQIEQVDPQTNELESEEVSLEHFKTQRGCFEGIAKKLDRLRVIGQSQKTGRTKRVEVKILGDRKYHIRINKLVSTNTLTCKPETIDSPEN